VYDVANIDNKGPSPERMVSAPRLARRPALLRQDEGRAPGIASPHHASLSIPHAVHDPENEEQSHPSALRVISTSPMRRKASS